MSLREEMWKYEQITGESAEHVPIIKLGAFLDGYEMGIKALEQTSYKSDARRWKRRYLDLKQRVIKLEEQQPCEDCISREAIYEALSEWDEQDVYLPYHFKELVAELPSVMPKGESESDD